MRVTNLTNKLLFKVYFTYSTGETHFYGRG
jgi:hypothetical protein